MNVIVGKTSIVLEHNDKVHRIAVDKYFDDDLISKLVEYTLDGKIGEYDHKTEACTQAILVDLDNGDYKVITKLPI